MHSGTFQIVGTISKYMFLKNLSDQKKMLKHKLGALNTNLICIYLYLDFRLEKKNFETFHIIVKQNM